MMKPRFCLRALAALVPALLLIARAGAAEVKTTDASCNNAFAILGWSAFDRQEAEAQAKADEARAKKEQAEKSKDRKAAFRFAQEESAWQERAKHWEAEKRQPWVKIGWILGRRKYLKRVTNVEQGVAQQVSFRQYRVKGQEGAYGYVANCGAGLTCNEIATVFHRGYKGIGTPAVQCSPLPDVLIDAVEPDIPLPSEEDLAKADVPSSDADDSDDDDEDSASKDKKDKAPKAAAKDGKDGKKKGKAKDDDD